jgi:hypothetical protein
MTPKEKAVQLRNSMILTGYALSNDAAKACALISVDEIIKSAPIVPNNSTPFNKIQSVRQNFIDAYEYWQEVKQEIEKL